MSPCFYFVFFVPFVDKGRVLARVPGRRDFIMMHREQHQVHQPLHGVNVGAFLQNILCSRRDEASGFLSLENYPQRLGLRLIQPDLFPVQCRAISS